MAESVGLIPQRAKVAELEGIYYRAQVEIRDTLLNVDPINYRELKAVSAQERINIIINKLNRQSIRWIKSAIPLAYGKSYVVAKTSLEILGAKRDDFFNMEAHELTIEDYIDKTMKDLITSNQSIKRNVDMYLYLVRRAASGLIQIQEFGLADDAIIEEIIAETIEVGESRRYASSRIQEYLRVQLLDGNFIDKSGRNYNLKDYSKMVARTRLRQVQTDAVKNTCKQYENDLVQWSSHADPCDECAEYEGEIFSLSGNHPIYSMLIAEPPIHPNCEHDISPTSEAAIGLREAYA